MRYLSAIASFLLFSVACQNSTESTGAQYFQLSGYAQGTTYHITYRSKSDKNLQNEVDSILNAFDMSLSTYQENSIISRINNNDPEVETDYWFETVFNKAQDISRLTDGAFDITVGPLALAWGFGKDKRQNMEQTKIDSLLKLVGYLKVRIENKHVVKENPDIKLDVNAIAQGYAVDVLAQWFDKFATDYMIELGGELIAKGVNPKNQKWTIGIDKPIEDSIAENRQLQEIVYISNKAMATSGNYRKFYEKDGQKFSHSIDPKTGKPVRRKILSATILANDCMTADALATTCMVVGLDKAVELISTHLDTEGYFVYADENGDFATKQTVGFVNYLNP